MRSSEGRLFQVEGPTTENARICLVEVRSKGTRRRPCWDEWSDHELIALRRGQQSSLTPTGARPSEQLQTKEVILCEICCSAGSHWRTSCMYLETWPNLGIPPIRWTAERKTRSKHPSRQAGRPA